MMPSVIKRVAGPYVRRASSDVAIVPSRRSFDGVILEVPELVRVHYPMDLSDRVVAHLEGKQCELATEPHRGRGSSVDVH